MSGGERMSDFDGMEQGKVPGLPCAAHSGTRFEIVGGDQYYLAGGTTDLTGRARKMQRDS